MEDVQWARARNSGSRLEDQFRTAAPAAASVDRGLQANFTEQWVGPDCRESGMSISARSITDRF